MFKKILIIIFLVLNINFTKASDIISDIDVKANIDSGTYNFVLEVFLISKPDGKKIFYYTDGIGRYDQLMEFKKENPIIIKSDTVLNYYAIGENYSSTKIKENVYKFNYSKDIVLEYDVNKIIIKNNSKELQNIGYWLIVGDNIKKEIEKNTFLEPKKTLEISYKAKNKETIKLFSPDKKIEKKVIFQQKIKENIEEKNLKDKKNLDESIDDNIIINKNDLKNNLKDENKDKDIELIKQEINEFDINKNLTSSVIDKKQNSNNFYIILIIFVIITFLITLYNIYIVVKQAKNIKKVEKNKFFLKSKR